MWEAAAAACDLAASHKSNPGSAISCSKLALVKGDKSSRRSIANEQKLRATIKIKSSAVKIKSSTIAAALRYWIEEQIGRTSSVDTKSWRTMLHQEPIIVWSCIIGAVGLVIPVVVPPIRESFSKSSTVNPPPLKKLISDTTKKE